MAVNCWTSFFAYIWSKCKAVWPIYSQNMDISQKRQYGFMSNRFLKDSVICTVGKSNIWILNAPIFLLTRKATSNCVTLAHHASSRKEAAMAHLLSRRCRARFWAVSSGWRLKSSMKRELAARVIYGRWAARLSRCLWVEIHGVRKSMIRIFIRLSKL